MTKLCFIDTETTSVTDGRLVQLAYEFYDDSQEEPEGIPFECKYKPPVPIELEAMAVHHITEKMVADLPAFNPDDLSNFFEKFLFTAHNAKFDIAVLEREGVTKPKYFIDTLKIAKTYLDLPCYKLQYLRYFFNVDIEADAHDALGDIKVLKAVFFKLFTIAFRDMTLEGIVQPQEVIAKFVNISINPVEIKRFSFGKHKGELFADVVKTDLDYILWLKKDCDKKPKEEQDEDLMHTIALYL